MAKRVSKKKKVVRKAAGKPKLTIKDRRTLKSLRTVADQVVKVAQRSRAPHLDIPSRSLSNVRYNKRKRFIEMGSSKNRRELFNLSQAKSYMQTMLVSSGCKQLIEQGKTTSIRGMYYLLKHTIEGTKEETFDDQADCDPVIEDVEVTMNALREELHVYASNRGSLVGNIQLTDSGDSIDCARMGSPCAVRGLALSQRTSSLRVFPTQLARVTKRVLRRRQVWSTSQMAQVDPRLRITAAAPARALESTCLPWKLGTRRRRRRHADG